MKHNIIIHPRNTGKQQRLHELLSDFLRDKQIIGQKLNLIGEQQLIHRAQCRAIRDMQRENEKMRAALTKIHERMRVPAGNRRFMQIAGPARECINLAKPFAQTTKPFTQIPEQTEQ
jgi:hypothetical protein